MLIRIAILSAALAFVGAAIADDTDFNAKLTGAEEAKDLKYE